MQFRESVAVCVERTTAGVVGGPLAVLVNAHRLGVGNRAGAIQYMAAAWSSARPLGQGPCKYVVLYRWPPTETRAWQVSEIAQFFLPCGDTQNKGVVPDVSFPTSVGASEYGESTYDNALPWTRIAAVPHVRYGNFSPLLGKLDARHDARVAADVEFQWWAEDVRTFREEQAKKSISLNETERRAERDKYDALRKFRAEQRVKLGIARDPLLDGQSDDGLQADERNVAQDAARELAARKVTDPLLRESAAILGDAIALLRTDATLAAQVLPEAKTSGHWVD